MALVTSKEMFAKAYDGGYAIGAFNVNNMEIVQGITEACQEEHAPVILQVSKGARAYANHTYLVKLVEAAVATCPDIPIVLHLDHGPDFETCKSCIDGGFTSVMIDASSKPFAENIEITRKVVEYAHDHGVKCHVTVNTMPRNDEVAQLPAYMEHVKYYSDLAIPLFNIHIFVNYNGYFILPILAAGGQFLMTKLTGTAQTPAADDAQAQQAQNSMKFMNYFFPIFTLILCFNYNAIFALYWVASNVIAIVQTKGINMYLDRKEALEAANPNKNTGSLK